MKWNYFNRTNNIDLRSELHDILNGNYHIIDMGQWVILRRFDLNSTSQYYNEMTREGVGGPKYNYTDTLYKTYKWNSWVADPFSEQDISVGQLLTPLVTFFFEHDVKPTEHDEIFEFDYDEHTVKPVLSSIPKPYQNRYNIKSVQIYRMDKGRVEFYACRSVKDSISY